MYHRLLPALAAGSLTAGTCAALLQQSPDPARLLTNVAGAFWVYHLDRCARHAPEDKEAPSRRTGIDGLLTWAAGAALLTGLIGLGISRALIVLLTLGLPSLLYVFPLLPKKRRLKDLPYLKLPLGLLLWTLACVLLPVYDYQNISPTHLLIPFATWRALLLGINLLLSDWPDRQRDAAAGIQTFAQKSADESHLRRRCIALLLVGSILLLPACHTLGLPASGLLIESVGALVWLTLLMRVPLPDHKTATLYLVFDLLISWPLIHAAGLLPGA